MGFTPKPGKLEKKLDDATFSTVLGNPPMIMLSMADGQTDGPDDGDRDASAPNRHRAFDVSFVRCTFFFSTIAGMHAHDSWSPARDATDMSMMSPAEDMSVASRATYGGSVVRSTSTTVHAYHAIPDIKRT